MKKTKIILFVLVLLSVFICTEKVHASVVFNQSPSNEINNGSILSSPRFVSFFCPSGLDCGISGQTVYNVGVWIKKVGNPENIRLGYVNDYNDPTGASSIFSNPIQASSISDKFYTLKWFYFPSGVVIGGSGVPTKFFQFQFGTTTGAYNPTDNYRVLMNPSNDNSAPQQWCESSGGCKSSIFYWRMDNSQTDLSQIIIPVVTPTTFTGNIFSQTDGSGTYMTTSGDLNVMQSLGKGKSGTITKIKIHIGQDSDYEWNGSYNVVLHDMGIDNTYNGARLCYLTKGWSDFTSKGISDRDIIFDDSTVSCTGGMTRDLDPTHYYAFQIYLSAPMWTNAKLYIVGSPTETFDAPLYLTNTQQYPGGIKTAFIQVDGINVPAPEPTGYSNVLFIPGLEASRLYAPDYNGGTDKLWEPGGNDDLTRKLLMNADGTAVRDDIYTKDVIDNAYIPKNTPIIGGMGYVYESFLKDLKKWKEVDHIITDYAVTPYDWRLSLDDILSRGNATSEGKIYYSGPRGATSTPYIIQELRRLASSSPTGKVTIIAHSNGGLVTKALTNKLGVDASKLIDKIIFVAVPQVGTPKAIGALLHGFEQTLPISMASFRGIDESTARLLGQNMPSAYNLLPSTQYFTYVDDPVITFSNDPLLATWRTKYGAEIHSSERLRNFLVDNARLYLPTSDEINLPTILNAGLLDKADTVHSSILDDWKTPQGIAVTEIAGWGEDTLKTINYYKGSMTWCSVPGNLHTCKDFPSLEYDPMTVVDGDGTVVVPSALWMAIPTGVAKYWVNLREYGATGFLNSTINRKHADIFEVPQLRILINNLLVNSTSTLPLFVYNTQPQAKIDDVRLRFLLHSPLDLSATDNIGNSIGSTTSTIPGSRFARYGEVQVLTVPKNTPITLNLNGYATGSFTLDMEEIDGRNHAIASSTFSGIPSATSTKASIVFSDGTLQNASPLSMDYNGDSITDFTLGSKVGEIITFDTTPPEVIISFSTTTQNIAISGIDETSGTTVVNTATSSIIFDETGNTLKLVFLKSKEGKNEIKLQMSRLIYNDISASNTPKTVLKYEWENDKSGKIKEFEEEITIGALTVKGHYDVKKNVTIIERSVKNTGREDTDDEKKDNDKKSNELNKSEKKTKEIRSGLVIIGVKTNRGIINTNN